MVDEMVPIGLFNDLMLENAFLRKGLSHEANIIQQFYMEFVNPAMRDAMSKQIMRMRMPIAGGGIPPEYVALVADTLRQEYEASQIIWPDGEPL